MEYNRADFVKEISKELENKTKINKRMLEKIGAKHNIISKTLIKELSELAIVIRARSLINFAKSIKDAYYKLVDLYNIQFNLSLRTSHSMMLQQYSTPAPIAYLASVYVKKHKEQALYFEPSAGNGLLTIALPYYQTYVNEIDDIRHENLRVQLFEKITKKDATQPFFEYTKKFDGVVTNPPFGTLEEPIKVDDYKIKHLDHAMAIIALDTMKDEGKAAIIIGGHSTWDSKGRLTKGKNRIFLNYLYNHYNVEDIIPIYGKKLYTKQGTGFDTRLILINGRKKEPDGAAPLKTEQLSTVVYTFDELWQRVAPLLQQDEINTLEKLKERAKALLIKQRQLL